LALVLGWDDQVAMVSATAGALLAVAVLLQLWRKSNIGKAIAYPEQVYGSQS